MKTVSTGWRTVTPGACMGCGSDDEWECDGRGNILCSCQACPDCDIVDAYGFHNAGCSRLSSRAEAAIAAGYGMEVADEFRAN